MAVGHCLAFMVVLFAVMCLGLGVILDFQETHSVTPTTAEVHSECYGTHNGWSYSGTRLSHYQRMRSRYSGCTHVIGSLELTLLDEDSIDYDLSFLRDIRYVSGYVLIGSVRNTQEIPLHNLEIIRGNNTFAFFGGDYALAVLLTSPKSDKAVGLKELQLPSLKEISNGKVVFQINPSLGFIDTINWDVIVRHTPNAVDYRVEAFNTSVSGTYMGSDCPSGRMWGRGFCQADVPDIQCHSSCNGRCFGSGSDECCHATCAVGCHGPTNQDCILCKDYAYNSTCVGFCPARSYPDGQICVPY